MAKDLRSSVFKMMEQEMLKENRKDSNKEVIVKKDKRQNYKEEAEVQKSKKQKIKDNDSKNKSKSTNKKALKQENKQNSLHPIHNLNTLKKLLNIILHLIYFI